MIQTNLMGHSHIIAIDEQGLNALSDDKDAAALELGTKILELCSKFENPLNRFAESYTESPRKELEQWTLESIGSCVGAIHWVGFPGSDREEIFYWGAGLKPIQQVEDKALERMKRRIEREIAARAAQH